VSIAYNCMLIVILLPYIWVGVAKFGRDEHGPKRYNNHAPRLQQDKLDGWRKRAVWAQHNAFESMPGFLAAMLVAMHAGVDAVLINAAAVTFVTLRVVHGVLYIADKPMLRTLSWALGVAVVVFLFVATGMHA